MVVLFFVSLVVASLVSSVGFVGLVSGLLSFALLCGVLSLVCFGVGFAVFGARSFSGELPGESVEFGPVASAVVVPLRRRAARAVACSAVVEVLVVEASAVEVRSAAGVVLSGAARERRLRYLASRG
jgi:hypothetical protein